jgi:DNA polymerase I-like protein with 3'-5' exonuclease and polymerase domains
MKVYNLHTAQRVEGQQKAQIYNLIDCIATRRISDVLKSRLAADPAADRYYKFEMAARNPAFAMTRRGLLVDVIARDRECDALRKEMNQLVRDFRKHPLVTDVWDWVEKETGTCPSATRKDHKHKWERGVEDTPERRCVDCGASRYRPMPFNANSNDQVSHLLYDLYRCKPQHNKSHKVSVDEECLGRIGKANPKVATLCDDILAIRGLKKQIGFLKARLTDDGKYRAELVVGTAWTGRWASHSDPMGYSGNVQNISERHRHIFIAEPGRELCYADLKQAESNIVAHLAGDEAYIAAHKDDTHTFVSRLTWPELPWTWDIEKDKAIAKSIIPKWDNIPGHDMRYQAKAVQHGGNLGLTAFGLAIQKHISLDAAREAQSRYFTAFPGIRAWQNSVAVAVRNQDPLVNPLGIKIKLYGRPWDDHTRKQGLGYLPQSTVAHIINIAAWRIWKLMDPHEVRLLVQAHDALVFDFPEGRYDLVRKACKLMQIPISVLGTDGKSRITSIGVEAAVGFNWGHYDKEHNPRGIKEIEI